MRIARVLASLLLLPAAGQAQVTALELPAEIAVPADVDLAGDFSFRLLVRLDGPVPADLPLLAANKPWASGEVRDYTTNNAYGLGRESGALAGFALSVLPDGAWTWNAGDGRVRLDHRPEAADQGIADGAWHEIGFAVDREQGVVHLFHDGVRVALHDLQGLGSLASEASAVQLGAPPGLQLADLRLEPGAVSPADVTEAFVQRFGEARRPAPRAVWDGGPLEILAWNIWHGGRRKGRDEGVQRVVEVIRESGADIVLMQETYGSGPRIAGRLGFEYYLRSSNLSILSRFPIRTVHRLYQGFRFGGATIELRSGTAIEAYSLWINYLPDVGAALAAGATGEELALADAQTRGAEIDGILADLLVHLEGSPAVPVLVGGDFNSGSHLDWTEDAARLANHHGRVVPWPVSLAMARTGFLDTFRARHPDPMAAPGHTWSPEFPDDHPDRIDYVYASAGDWRVLESRVLADHPRGWPSDHAAVLSTLELLQPVDVFLLAGQSNMEGVGRVELVPDRLGTVPGVQLFHSRAIGDPEHAERWLPLGPAGWRGGSRVHFGVELSLGAALTAASDGRETYFIKHAVGGTDLFEDWTPDGGPQYEACQELVGRALAELEERGLRPVVRGVFWQQGEADAKDGQRAGAYRRNLETFIDRLRASVAPYAPGRQPTDVRFVLGQVIPDATPGSAAAGAYPFRDVVREAQLAVAAELVNVATVPTDPSFGTHATVQDGYRDDDNIHFDAAGLLLLGERMAEAFLAGR